jgi:hypothetical protein
MTEVTTDDAALDAWDSEGGLQLDEAQRIRDRSQYLRRKLQPVLGATLIVSAEGHPACSVIRSEPPVDDVDESGGSFVRGTD